MGLMEKANELRKNAKVRVTLTDGTVLTGRYLDFTKAIQNDPPVASIDLQVGEDIYELYEDEIKKVESV